MSFVGHLEELRLRLLRVLLFLVLAWIPAFVFTDRLLPFLLSPLGAQAENLVCLRPAEKFMTYLGLSFAAALLASLPVLACQLARFVWPALEGRQKRQALPFLAFDLLLLAGGLAFAWFLLIPFATDFFLGFGSRDGIRTLWSLGEYAGMAGGLLVASALVFQLPPVLLFAFRAGLLRVAEVARYRRHAIILIFILAAVITPPDILSQCLTAVPLWLLFELTLLLGRRIGPRPTLPEK
jgi:sec-independent protein translocase protein TatC